VGHENSLSAPQGLLKGSQREATSILTQGVLLPMDYADGGSLRDWMRQNPDVKERQLQALEYFKQACEGVKAIHEAGLVHLDLKPENLLIHDGVVKVTDFGLSRGTLQHSVASQELMRDGIGTPAYMAPEQVMAARPQDVEHFADIYALGVMLFELLDGHPPYEGTAQQILDKIERGIKPKLRGVEGPLAATIWQCLEKDETKRFHIIDELLQALVGKDFKAEIKQFEVMINKWELTQAHKLLQKVLAEGLPQAQRQCLQALLEEAEAAQKATQMQADQEYQRLEAEARKQHEEETKRRSVEADRLKKEKQEQLKREVEQRRVREEENRRKEETIRLEKINREENTCVQCGIYENTKQKIYCYKCGRVCRECFVNSRWPYESAGMQLELLISNAIDNRSAIRYRYEEEYNKLLSVYNDLGKFKIKNGVEILTGACKKCLEQIERLR
jgi:serine/threonine-protein kinase RIO1